MGLDSTEDTTERASDTPAGVYSRRLEELEAKQAEAKRRERLLGYAKLAIGLPTILSAVLLIHHPAAMTLLLLPVAIFVVLAILHEKSIEFLRHRARTIAFYERGLARLNDRWQGSGETGERFLDPMHPYARDLDLFGKASLFEFLCTARTRAGEETLAAWLLAPAPVEEILARQAAVRELLSRVEFREKLFSQGETLRLGVRPEALSSWGERKPDFPTRPIVLVCIALAVLWFLSLLCWAVWNRDIFVLPVSLLNLAFYYRLRARLKEATTSAEEAGEDLNLLAGILSLLEREPLFSPKLVEIQARLKRRETMPSVAVRKIARVIDYLAQQHNKFCRAFDYFTFWSIPLAFMVKRWQREFGPAIRGWLSAVGEFETLAALSGFAYEQPGSVFPELTAQGPLFEVEGFVHPLLPAGKAVPNDLKLGGGPGLMILSGPNMAGKSTFIRGVGVNAILAQCGAPVRARRLRLSPLRVAASICVLDSLSGGVSRFYAEIRRIKLISDLAHGPLPVLFLLDELLSGTNSHDRLVGTQFIVRSLLDQHAIGIVSTHDLALTRIPETMGERAVNCHFEDRLGDDGLVFDYKLKPGVVQTSNALKLMRSVGLTFSS